MVAIHVVAFVLLPWSLTFIYVELLACSTFVANGDRMSGLNWHIL